MCPSTTPVADDDEADELLPPPPPPLAAAAAAAAEEAPLADAALEDDAAVEEVAPHTSNRRAYGCSTARRPAALLWISRMPETFAPAAASRTWLKWANLRLRAVSALYGSRHAPPVDLDFAKN